jgi:hypothetical protein
VTVDNISKLVNNTTLTIFKFAFTVIPKYMVLKVVSDNDME